MFKTLQAFAAIPGVEALTAGGRFPLRIALRSSIMPGYEIRSEVTAIGPVAGGSGAVHGAGGLSEGCSRRSEAELGRWVYRERTPGRWSRNTRRARACASTCSASRRRCAATRAQFGEDEDDWGAVALLHDFDYERYPDQENHPFRGVEILKAKGYPEWVTRAILSHADYSGVPRESRLEKTLYACDEMSGFVTAASLVRPSKSIMDLEASSVIKRMKDKAFARAVNRDDLKRGAEELGIPLDQHITNVIAFMRESRPMLSGCVGRCDATGSA